MTLNECVSLFYNIRSDLAKKHPFLVEWHIDWKRRGTFRALGTCCFKPKLIKMNIEYVLKGKEADIKDTILHEFAHAIAYNLYRDRGHGRFWKMVCREIGAIPRSCKASGVEFSGQRGYKWSLVHRETGEVYKKYKNRPKWANRVHMVHVTGQKLHTWGKLVLKEI